MDQRGILRGRQLAHVLLPTEPGGAPRTLYGGLDFELSPGAFTAVIGPNGAGKSTLLRQLVGISRCQVGTLTLEGRPLAGWPPAQRAQRIAYLPQQTPLYVDLTVREIVMLGRAPHMGRFGAPSQRDREGVAAALAQVELDALAHRAVGSLSGGERQRVMLARMLATDAPILVLDEPTTALDIGHTLAFLELCRHLAGQGRTVVVAMHELELARRYAQQALFLKGDGSGEFGATAKVMNDAELQRVFGVAVRRIGDAIGFFATDGAAE